MNLRKYLLTISAIFLLFSCGQKSKITPMAEPVKLAQTLGDGEHVVINVNLPLSDRTLDAIDAPVDAKSVRVPLFGDLAHLITKSFYNLGARLGLGRMLLKIEQPIPDLDSELIHSIKVKRIFFNIEKKEMLEEENLTLRNRVQNGWDKFRLWLRGGDQAIDLSFIRELKLRVSTTNRPVEVDLDETTVDYMELSDKKLKQWRLMNDDKHEIVNYLRDQNVGLKEIGEKIIVVSDAPVRAKNYFEKNEEMKKIVEKVTMVNRMLLIELKEQELADQIFFEALNENETIIDELKVLSMDKCRDLKCMDFNLEDVNLKPVVSKGNNFLIETYIDVSQIPPSSFQLNGFVEFEVKLNSPI